MRAQKKRARAEARRRREEQHVKEHTPSGGVGENSFLHTYRGCCAKSAPGAQHLILLMGFSRWKTRKEFLKSARIWVLDRCAFDALWEANLEIGVPRGGGAGLGGARPQGEAGFESRGWGVDGQGVAHLPSLAGIPR